MEQMYLIEVFIDKVTIFLSEEEGVEATNKGLIIKVQFGPKLQFIIKEGQLAKQNRKDEIIEDEGIKKWIRSIRVGKSYLFPSYTDTLLMLLTKFPLELEIWNDDENEVEIFIGVGTMLWDTEFFLMLKESTDATKKHDPLSVKQNLPIYAECCCKQVGIVSFILRLSVLGDSLLTDFQQLMQDPDQFIFQTNRAPSKFQCKRIEPDDPNYNTQSTLYETTILEEPGALEKLKPNIELCTQLQSCGMAGTTNYTCVHDLDQSVAKIDDKCEDPCESKKHIVHLDKIRMGEIIGPCGNANCALAHKIKNYIRNLETYKKEYVSGAPPPSKDNVTRKICGTCSCKDDRYHSEELKDLPGTSVCGGCQGLVLTGDSCEDRKNKMFGTGLTPKHSPTQINYMFNVTKGSCFKQSKYRQEFIEETLGSKLTKTYSEGMSNRPESEYNCHKTTQYTVCNLQNICNDRAVDNVPIRNIGTNDNFVYNTSVESSKNFTVYNAYTTSTESPNDKECKCNPQKRTPPCKTFDCDCISEIINISARKHHKPYCPLYKHKPNCPVTMSLEEENPENLEEVEDKVEPLPYGLPPIRLGPCPILGRPCSVPDGFARMYKTAVQPPMPPSHSEAGKVCCSKEYWRIKKAIKEYLKNHKEDDYKCLNRFNVDTERRCCDKEQALLELMGRGCCGAHKLSIQDKYKEK